MVITKYFWSLYKLSLLWQHFSKLEFQTKGTFMLECRRVTINYLVMKFKKAAFINTIHFSRRTKNL